MKSKQLLRLFKDIPCFLDVNFNFSSNFLIANLCNNNTSGHFKLNIVL